MFVEKVRPNAGTEITENTSSINRQSLAGGNQVAERPLQERLTGEIVERQRDQLTREWKCVVNGKSLDSGTVGIVGKLSITGCLVIITIYRVQA